MCTADKKRVNPNLFFALAIVCGIMAGCLHNTFVFSVAETLSQLFINLLKLVSLPIIFLSIVSTASGMENIGQIKYLGIKVVKYTLMTTVVAATIALLLFIFIDPVQVLQMSDQTTTAVGQPSYLTFFIKMVPSNIIQPFAENNVMGVLFLAIVLSFTTLALPNEQRSVLHTFFSSVYSAIIVLTKWVVMILPIAVWSFITLFMRDLDQGLEVKNLALYLCCVVGANILQATIILPLLLKIKGVSPLKLLKAVFPVLSMAFFTKSSAAALPLAIRCAEENAGISKKVANFTLPLCTTINMNACAAFILTTVLFVSMSEGMTYTYLEMGLWVILATIAAVGNAGVPMGCYFLATAFLAAMNVPLTLMGVILPFYTLIDMLESSINVWSDCCVAAVVDEEIKQENPAFQTA